MILTKLEEQITSLIEPTLADLGYALVRVKYFNSTPPRLEILVENKDRSPINVEDCRKISYNISAILDVEIDLNSKYMLEVSSPGVERPLVKLDDFTRFINHTAKFTLYNLTDNRKRLTGKIKAVKDDIITVETEEQDYDIDYSNISSSNLVLTDEMLREILNKKHKEN